MCRGIGITEHNSRGTNAIVAHCAIGIEDGYLCNATVIKCSFSDFGNAGLHHNGIARQAEIQNGLILAVQNAVFGGQCRIVCIHADSGDSAFFKCIVCNGCHIFGDGDAFKAAAIIECAAVDCSKACGKADGGKIGAVAECIFADGCDRIGNVNAGKAFAVIKCALTDACQLALSTESNCIKIFTAVESIVVEGGDTVGNCNACNSRAVIESSVTDVCQLAVGAEGNTLKIIAFLKCGIGNVRYSIGDGNGRNSGTCKSVCFNGCQTVRNGDILKGGAIYKSGMADGGDCVGNCKGCCILFAVGVFDDHSLILIVQHAVFGNKSGIACFHINICKLGCSLECFARNLRNACRQGNFRKGRTTVECILTDALQLAVCAERNARKF